MSMLRVSLPVGSLSAGALAACNSSEATAPDHNPDRVAFAVNGAAMPDDTPRLSAGATGTVRLTYYQGTDNLEAVETEHFSLLIFTPAIAAATLDTAHHFSQVVVVSGQARDTGQVDVGFGHDLLADEHTFTLPVKVQ